jgi:hypothetical protein
VLSFEVGHFDQRSALPQFKQPSSTSTVSLSTASLSTSTTKSDARQNDHVDRAPANTVSKIRNGPTGASVQHFVRWLLELLRSIARSRSRHHTT